MKVLVTGAKGFITGYLIEELLNSGYYVIGIDNLSKYGQIEKSYDNNPNYKFIEGDAKNIELMVDILKECEHFIAGAAMIGGISYFHEFAYDLLAENERIISSEFDAAIKVFKDGGKLKKITVMSSSMIHESTNKWPAMEGDEYKIPPPRSTYGFQKLACHYYCQGAWEQYKLPYTLVVPFNAIGIGEVRAKSDSEVYSGNVKLALSHVVPDLVQKIVKGQDPLHILGKGNQIRHYTYGGDLAKGIVATLENEKANNEEFNIAVQKGHTVKELAEVIWKKIKGDKPLKFVHDKPFEYDVQKRVPDVDKAKKLLGFEAKTSLEKTLDEVIPWIEKQIKLGTI
ncbi:MAG: NAD-dependent epimerase/dehydratase family protein [bacterium]